MKRFIFWLFKKDFIRFVYEGGRISKLPADRLEFAFYDQDGLAYYSVKGDYHPMLRKINLAIVYTKLITGISELDISASLQAIHDAINEQNDKGKMAPNIAQVGFICTQLLGRRGRIVVPDYLYELAANYFIREDESFELWDEDKTKDKQRAIEQLPLDVIKQFFFSKQLNEVFPFAENPEEFFADILREGEIETMAYLKAINKSNGSNRRDINEV